MIPFDVRTLPAEALLGADARHPAIVRAEALALGRSRVPHAVRAGLLRRLGRSAEAAREYGLAAGPAASEAERAYPERYGRDPGV